MSKYYYRCEGCGNKVPGLQVERFIDGPDGLCHTVGEKQPEPCGPVRKFTVIENPPKLWSPCMYEIDASYCESCGRGDA